MSARGLMATPFSRPLSRPFRTAQGVMRMRRGFLVSVTDDAGREGMGEAAPLSPWTEDLKACGAALEDASDKVVRPVGDADEAWDRVQVMQPHLVRTPAARHALSEAFLDLAAQQQGVPLCILLAKLVKRSVPSSVVPVNAVLGATEPQEAAQAAKAAVQAGYRAVKLKLAGTPKEDAARVEAVRAAVGPGVELRLDANGAWSLEDAAPRLAELAQWKPAYLEQPTPADDLAALRALRERRIVPIAADEAARTPERARQVMEVGACDVLIIKPMALGGPDHAVEVLHEAWRRRVPAVVTTLLDGPVAREGALHVAATLSEPRPACGLALADGHDQRVERGLLRVRDAPGLGLGARRR